MDNEIKISNQCETNAANIQLSEHTKSLILCRAKLQDVYNQVKDIADEELEAGIPDSFADEFTKLDTEIMLIIRDVIDDTSFRSDHKYM